MTAIAFDTLKLARKLRDSAGMTQIQAEGVADALAEAMSGAELATKTDITMVRRDLVGVESSLKRDMAEMESSLKRDMAEMESSLKRDIADVRTELKTDMVLLERGLKIWFGKMMAWQLTAIAGLLAIATAAVKLL